MTTDETLRRGGRLVRLELAAASVIAGLTALSVGVFLPGETALFGLFAVTVLGFGVATFVFLARIRTPRLRLNLIGRVPLAAGVSGDDFKLYLDAAPASVKLWARATAATAIVAVLAANPLNFFAGGSPEIHGGRYVETSHGTVVRTLTRQQYEELEGRLVRFAGLIGTLMLTGLSTMLSGAIETDGRSANPASD